MASEGNSYKELIIVDALPSTGALMIPNFKSEYMVYDAPYNKQLLAMGDADFESMALPMASIMTVNQEKQAKIMVWMINADRETYVYGVTDLLKLHLREAFLKSITFNDSCRNHSLRSLNGHVHL